MTDMLAALTEAVIRVGNGCRGFLVEWPRGQTLVVITAAHCLPALPQISHPAAYAQELTCPDLLGPLDGSAHAPVAAELMFVDPVADLAVLGAPDIRALPDEFKKYDAFVESRPGFRLAAMGKPCPGWVLSLDRQWSACTVSPGMSWRSRLAVVGAKTPNGMSGSPILQEDGRAVGVVSCDDLHPRLDTDLSGLLLLELELLRSAPRRTGLVCPSCRQPVAILEGTQPSLQLACPACGHRSSAKNRG